jgi:hypothetical protein
MVVSSGHVDLLAGNGSECGVAADETVDPDRLVDLLAGVPLVAPVAPDPVLSQLPAGGGV